ncbi:hypothetical protein BOTBODRAFT_105442 [Botryobasidium botryosum FD-172 SS1]|uniref:Uncharacterized protein n=1 Tax=Botryobasidium botryosum (strain FD-172 SS1) TaxID=930990 RepID=A0A067MSK0_BOTB1|nr:hypothetical protein BOTBODRAFT_105442 [Botryobasidium botryosum FD-172 SS1]
MAHQTQEFNNQLVENNSNGEDKKLSPPAFLDLADSAARLSSNLPDINSRIEQKRLEHERQRNLQRKMFEEQMRMLEQQQLQEERALLKAETPGASPVNGLSNLHQHIAMSAPTTPPHNPVTLQGDMMHMNGSHVLGADSLRPASLLIAKRKSVQYASSLTPSPESASTVSNVIGNHGSHNHAAGAKSMPASRRASAGSKDGEEVDTLALRNMSLNDPSGGRNQNLLQNRLNGDNQYNPAYSAALLFDEDLDNEMQSKRVPSTGHYPLFADIPPRIRFAPIITDQLG